MLSVTVYTKPQCVQCDQTKKLFAKDVSDAVITEVDVTTDAEALRYVTQDLGYAGAPVVQWEAGGTTGGHWSGFRPDRIRELKTYTEEHDRTPVLTQAGSTA